MAPRILLVEDDPVSREVIASLLISRGYETHTADDGFSALRMAQDTAYALVFIDYHLPEMDGYALARLMRSLGEKTNADLKMIAITADQFGLAARRGVDTVFDRVLSKPIAPDALFAFVDEFLGAPAQLETIETFLAPEPASADEPSCPGLALWRARGLDRFPTARAFPAPTASERESLENCFRITEAASADCVLLLRAEGLADVERLRLEAPAFLMPLVVLDHALAAGADVVFEPSKSESWTRAAEVLAAFASRRALVSSDVACSVKPEIRLAAYLFVADRQLQLQRGAKGQTIVPYAAGFPVATLVESVKQLAALGLVASKLEAAREGGAPELVVSLSAGGIRHVAGASAADRTPAGIR